MDNHGSQQANFDITRMMRFANPVARCILCRRPANVESSSLFKGTSNRGKKLRGLQTARQMPTQRPQHDTHRKIVGPWKFEEMTKISEAIHGFSPTREGNTDGNKKGAGR
jgi:hypothetical protein